MSAIKDLEPRIVWGFFDEITRVPRPSKHEEKIRAFLVDFAKSRGLEYRTDAVGNVVILKGATEGMEGRPAVVLQSHMDMVCEKNGDVKFDFMKDAIRTRIDNGWVRAEGTTLGADCGIGMAAALAVLASDDVAHGPVEALFTVDEETGLTGAFGLGEGMISGKYLINLDSEDEGEIFIGCAGGIDTLATFTYKTEKNSGGYVPMRIEVKGLKGGHSGDDIEKGHANSNKIMARLLNVISRRFGARLSHMDGGNLRNAIPREAFAVVGVPVANAVTVEEYIAGMADTIGKEFRYTEPNMSISVSRLESVDGFIDAATQKRLVDALCGVQNGVLAMSRTLEGLVETSTNLASVKFEGNDKIVVTTSQRSSVGSERDDAASSVEAVFDLAGAKVEHSDGYPGWTPDPESELLKVTASTYNKLFGNEPKVRAIHAGLECGLFLERYPELDMVSFGPTLRGVHSPDERLEIATVDKFWKLLTAVLAGLK